MSDSERLDKVFDMLNDLNNDVGDIRGRDGEYLSDRIDAILAVVDQG